MYKVAVLLSTYNGERYLIDQLNSLLQQKEVELIIFIRDDGSNDGTKNIINDYAGRMNIKFIEGQNVGFETSFKELVQYVGSKDKSIDYYAFCDQDDVWYSLKTLWACESLRQYDCVPTLYSSGQDIINEEGILLRSEPIFNYSITRRSSLLALNQRGCTMVWNKMLQDILVQSYDYLDTIEFVKIPAHDTWITLITYGVGKVITDKRIGMGYRVSSHNVAGSYIGFWGRIEYVFHKIERVISHRRREHEQYAKYLYNFLSDLNTDREYIKFFLNSQKSIISGIKFINTHSYFKGMSIKWRIFASILILLRRF